MYPITQNPGLALDLAHAMMDENRRRAAAPRRTPRRRDRAAEKAFGPTRRWTRRPALAI